MKTFVRVLGAVCRVMSARFFDGGSAVDLGAEPREYGVRGREAVQDIAAAGTVPHQPDAPYFAGHGTESRSDFEAVFAEQMFPDDGFVDTLGDRNGIQLRQPIRFRYHELKTH